MPDDVRVWEFSMSPWLILTVFSAASVLVPQAVHAQWQVDFSRDPMTDELRKIAFASSGARTLAVACKGAKNADVLVSLDEYLGEAEAEIRTRFDREPMEDWRSVRLSPTGTAFLIPGGETQLFIDELKRRSRLLIDVVDFRGEIHRTEFSLRGSAAAIGSLGACAEEPKELAERKEPFEHRVVDDEYRISWRSRSNYNAGNTENSMVFKCLDDGLYVDLLVPDADGADAVEFFSDTETKVIAAWQGQRLDREDAEWLVGELLSGNDVGIAYHGQRAMLTGFGDEATELREMLRSCLE